MRVQQFDSSKSGFALALLLTRGVRGGLLPANCLLTASQRHQPQRHTTQPQQHTQRKAANNNKKQCTAPATITSMPPAHRRSAVRRKPNSTHRKAIQTILATRQTVDAHGRIACER